MTVRKDSSRDSAYPFVVLFHDVPVEHARATGRGSHWDFMVATDEDGPLRTWALGELPDFGAPLPFVIGALALPDHRRDYLTFEGEVSGGRGTVERIASGVAVWLNKSSGAEQILLRLGPSNQESNHDWIAEFQLDAVRSQVRFERSSA